MIWNSWLLAFHLWSAFALVASMVLFWTLVVAARNSDSIEETIACRSVGDLGGKVIGDSYAIWDGWIIAAIVLWVIGGATGARAGVEYQKALTRAEELRSSGQQAQPGELRALNASSRGLLLLSIS